MPRMLQLTPDESQKELEIEGLQTVSSIDDLPQPKETSVSIITPPQVRYWVLYRVLPSHQLFLGSVHMPIDHPHHPSTSQRIVGASHLASTKCRR